MWPSAAVRMEEDTNAGPMRRSRSRSRSQSRSRGRSRDERYTGTRTCKRLFDAHQESLESSPFPSLAEDTKRFRDAHHATPPTAGGTTAFTCSLLENPASNALLWFGPNDGGGATRGIKSRNNRQGKPRGMVRRSRFLRSSPKPVNSLESCLRAQLRFDEDHHVSRSTFFGHYGGGGSNTPGLGEIEFLGAERPMFFKSPGIKRPYLLADHRSSRDALLFSLGVFVGFSRIFASSKSEVERLKKLLEEAEATVRALQMQVRAAPAESNFDRDSVRSGLTGHDNMAELEAQLEAELELMQLQSDQMISDDLEEDDLGEVVRDELVATGLPGVSDVDDDRVQSRRDGENWAVSPRELDRRLRMLLESRQEERISELETELHEAEDKLRLQEDELRVWKDRVQQLSAAETPTSKVREQSPVDDICDEFLRSVEDREGEQPEAVPVPEAEAEKNEPALKTDPTGRNWSSRHAGANTPNEELHINKLFNTPTDRVRGRVRGRAPSRADREKPSVVEKIKYWENLARCSRSDAPSSPRSSCSYGTTSWDDSSTSDEAEEHHLGDGLIQRLVEKSKNSTLLKDVQLMLAALEDDEV